MPTSLSDLVAQSGSGFAANGQANPVDQTNTNQSGQGIFGWQGNDFATYGPQGQIPTYYSTTKDQNGNYVPTYTLPASNENFVYANPNAFSDPNAGSIYTAIGQGFQNSTNQAPTANNTYLMSAAQYGGAGLDSGVQTADNSYNNAQASAINQLWNTANGVGPSVAVTTANQQRDANNASALSTLASQRGSASPALAARAARLAQAQNNQAAAQTGALGRANEALNAQGQLSSALNSARGQTQSIGTTEQNMAQQAGTANQSAINANLLQQGSMNQQTNLANLTANTANNQLNAQQFAQALQAYLQQNQTDISNNVAYQQMIKDEQLGNEQIATGHTIAQQGQDTGLAAAGVTALASLGAAAAAA